MQPVWLLPPALWEPRTRHPGTYLLGTAAVLATALAALAFVSAVRSNDGVPKTAGVTQPAMVRVDAAALTGQPVTQVQLRLHRLGLGVTLRWRITRQVRPGLVLAVSPAGLLRPHSQITVTGSRWPAPGAPGQRWLGRRRRGRSPSSSGSSPWSSSSSTSSSSARRLATGTRSSSSASSSSSGSSPSAG